MLDINKHQMPDLPSAFMKMIKGRASAKSAANDERREVLNPRIIWDGSIDRFQVFRNYVEGHYGQIGAGYLLDTEFQNAYFERGTDCYVDFWMKYHQLPSLRKMHVYSMAYYSVLVNVVKESES
jgi:hypothetical protein